MLVLTKNEIKDVIFTGSENSVINNPFFLFIFTNRITKEEVKFVLPNLSNTLRYDKVTIDVTYWFESAETGFWSYKIYEQLSDINLDSAGLNCVEQGYMYLNPSISYTPSTYNNQSNTFVTYNG